MKPQDLKIGNYVFDNGVLTTVTCIEENRLSTKDGKLPYSFYPEISGIPLTEEWLRKFGFKYQDRDVSHGKGKIERFFIYSWFADGDNWSFEINLVPRLKANGFFWLLWDIGGGRNFVHLPHTCKLEFVHQLQNFIYSLTGTELTIK